MSTSKKKGELAEAKALTRLLELKLPALIPWGDSCPYDLVFVRDGKFITAQVKSGKIKSGAVRFKAHIWNPYAKKASTYKGKVDVFLVYCAETECVYEVPVDEVSSHEGFLRLTPARNNQIVNIKFARDYVL